MKMKCVIWGAGKNFNSVFTALDFSKVDVCMVVDSDESKQGMEMHGFVVSSPCEIMGMIFDYIVISTHDYLKIYSSCIKMGIEKEKIIPYCKESEDNKVFKSRNVLVEELTKEKNKYIYRLDSAPYEWGISKTPIINDGVQLMNKIINDGKSLIRFGDGEFEIIRGNNRPWFQNYSESLGRALRNALYTKNESIIVAISQNYHLDKYTEEAADGIREYMYGKTRKDILDILEERVYFDAYVTRPYIIYNDKEYAESVFALFKLLFNKRDILLVEGEYSRIGVGNDFLESANSIRRIVCPSNNAWERYEEILESVIDIARVDDLILCSLGPTATVLCCQLANTKYQSIDIGQIDNEYEWWMMGTKKRTNISGKMVAEMSIDNQDFFIKDEVYEGQIVKRIN